VRNLVEIRSVLNLSGLAILAMGGVTTTEDVIAMLDVGADAVQAASILLENSLFGVEAHSAIAGWLRRR